MTSIRKLVCFVMAMTFAMFALPSLAAQGKLFNAVIPTFITSSPMTVKINNTSPGNSTINSLSITVTGNVIINCAGISPGTGTSVPNGCVITGFSGINSNTSRNFQLPISFSSGTCANATWTVNANTGNAYPQGTPFTPVDQQYVSSCDGTLACQDPSQPPDPSAQFSDAAVSGTRGPNKDGSACSTVGFDLTDFIVVAQPSNTVKFQWDTAVQANASFITTVHWNPKYVDPVTGLPKPTTVAYNLVGPPNYVPLIACGSPATFPAKYGALNAFTSSPDTITIDTTNHAAVLPAAPLALVIGTERMNASNPASVGTNLVKYDVQRAQGGTSPFALSIGLPVMSTSLPLNSAGIQQQACLVTQDITVVTSSDSPNCSSLVNPNAPNPPPACTKVDTLILFEGDPAFSQD